MTRFILGKLRDATRGRTGSGSAERTPGIVDLPIDMDGDPLAGFDPEDETAAGRSAGPAVQARRRVRRARRDGEPFSLDEVLERCSKLAWVEAVAILEALCEVLSGEDGQPSVPEALSEISITSEGTVLVRQARTDGPAGPGPRLARILLTLTAAATVPVPLRLFITKWASFAEPHSIADYAQELAYFARPEGQALIQAVYLRCQAAPPQSQFPLEKVVETPPTEKLQAFTQRKRHARFAAGAAGVSALSAAAMWLWTGSSQWESRIDSRQVSVEAPVPAPTVRPDEPGAVSLVAARVGEPVSPPRSPERSSSGLRPETRTPAPVPVDAAPARRFPELPRLTLPPEVPPPPVASALPDSAGADGRAVAAVMLPITSERTASEEAADRSPIYSSADSEVLPPVMLDAALPAPLLAGVSETNTMELVISERGNVERVRLVSQPRRMADMMLLSGAKNWRFEPASLDGRSVRYRLRLSWAATP